MINTKFIGIPNGYFPIFTRRNERILTLNPWNYEWEFNHNVYLAPRFMHDNTCLSLSLSFDKIREYINKACLEEYNVIFNTMKDEFLTVVYYRTGTYDSGSYQFIPDLVQNHNCIGYIKSSVPVDLLDSKKDVLYNPPIWYKKHD